MAVIKLRNILKLADKEDSNTNVNVRNNWKFPKIPVQKLYYKEPCTFFPTHSIKDVETTFSFQSSDKVRYLNFLSYNFHSRGRFIKKKHKFLHLGLVQVAINPLERDGLEGSILVFIADARRRNLKNSLLAVVEHNLAQGPFYFNCFPSFSVSLNDSSYEDSLRLSIKTSGVPTGVSLALTVRLVCKAMMNLKADYLEEPVLGMTLYRIPRLGEQTTFWDQVFDFSPDMGATSNRQ